jgi:hypothetical protein
MRIPTLAIAAALAAFGSSLFGASFSPTATARGPAALQQKQPNEERGCCILKGRPEKKSWEFWDDKTEEECGEMARQARMNWSFHKNKKCDVYKP